MGAPEIPGFTIERLLGEGGRCRVYLALEAGGLGRPVALKVFPRLGDQEDYARELAVVRRVEEVRRRERCPGIVQALDSGERPELAWIAFELCEGGSLAERVASAGPLGWEEALELTLQVAGAVALLHRERLFHRDIKPQNLLLGADGRVRLADFGLARPLDGTLTAAGSPAFAAPEVIAGTLDDGRRVDVYSLGATLAFLLTGQAMLSGRPDVFSLERRGVPRPLQGVIARAMSVDPSARQESMEQLAQELEAAGRGEDVAPLPPELAPARTAEERARAAQDLSEKCGYAAAALTLLPLPGSELVGVVPIHVGLVIGIGQIYGVEVTRDKASGLLAKIAATVGVSMLGRRVATTAAKVLLPGLGGVLSAPWMFASTVSLGRVARALFERGLELPDEELRGVYQQGLEEAKQRFDPRRARSREARALAEEAAEAPAEPARDPIARLERLGDLLARGLIDREAFEEHKRRILDEL